MYLVFNQKLQIILINNDGTSNKMSFSKILSLSIFIILAIIFGYFALSNANIQQKETIIEIENIK